MRPPPSRPSPVSCSVSVAVRGFMFWCCLVYRRFGVVLLLLRMPRC